MKKLTGFVLLFLLLIVIGLSVAVVNLYQNPRMMNEHGYIFSAFFLCIRSS